MPVILWRMCLIWCLAGGTRKTPRVTRGKIEYVDDWKEFTYNRLIKVLIKELLFKRRKLRNIHGIN